MSLSHKGKLTHAATQTQSVPYQWEGERSPFTSCINYEWQAKGQRGRRGHVYGQNIDLLPPAPLLHSLSSLLPPHLSLCLAPLLCSPFFTNVFASFSLFLSVYPQPYFSVGLWCPLVICNEQDNRSTLSRITFYGAGKPTWMSLHEDAGSQEAKHGLVFPKQWVSDIYAHKHIQHILYIY